MRILVYGAGVIGSNLAADLFACGKDVTILARGQWADCIEEKGLTIQSAFFPGKKTCWLPVIRELAPEDRYDVVFVVMRYNQVDSVIDALNANVSRNIVLVGNNVSTGEYEEKLKGKNVLFGFNMAAGHREADRVVSFTMKKITIGPRKETRSYKKMVRQIFARTKMKVTYQPNMEDYLLCHAAFVVPIAFACYHCDGNLRKIRKNKSYLNRIIDANIEGYRAIDNAGHQILPESDQDYNSLKYRRICYAVYKTICSTKIGQICASDHALNAVDEMTAMNEGLKRFYDANGAKYPIYKKLEKDAMKHLKG